MALYVVLCEDHRRNVIIVGNEKGAPFIHKEEADKVASIMKLEHPLQEFQSMQICGLKINNPMEAVEPFIVPSIS